ncbi:MAG TPA: hypothetical protein VM621_15115 [Luteibacter sp.]|uniref:hypothetical protein n=1 Tax=Luteibacter sp. TaxID=1886636 RepID=UPI002CFEC527|nr:hypothetical protein [Luteibacter sp.]HVI56371.1 hypothetical protein [Luteibacter sp.]
MRRAYSLLLAVAATLPLAGCYYDPGYVRRSAGGGDAYYGTETTVVQPGGGYYDPGYGYGFGPGYYGGYSDIAVGSVWYGGGGYDRRYYRDRDGYDHHRPQPGDWHGRPGDGDHRPPGGWQAGEHGDHPRPPGGWQGGDHAPPGGWHGGGGRPAPPAGGWHGGGRPSQGAPSSHWPARGNDSRGADRDHGH